MTSFKDKLAQILKQVHNHGYAIDSGVSWHNREELSASEALNQICHLIEEEIIQGDDKIKMVNGNRYIKASDMPEHYRNKLRASQRLKLEEGKN